MQKWCFEGQFNSLQVNIDNEMPKEAIFHFTAALIQYKKLSHGFGNSIPFVTFGSAISSSTESNSVEYLGQNSRIFGPK